MCVKILKKNEGFTLVELLVASAILGVIVALMVGSYGQQESKSVSQNQVVEVQQNARAGFHMIVNEIRMAGFDPHGDYDPGITAAGDGSNGNPLEFTYVADDDCIDNDNDSSNPNDCTDSNVDEEGELKTVTINLFDSSIDAGTDMDEIQISAAGGPIAENIAALQFTYLDQDNNITANLDDIRAVNVVLTARPAETERDLIGGTRTLQCQVKCRNLGLPN